MAPKSASAASPFLKPGDAIEICSEDDGFRGSWFTGKIVRRLANNKASVDYDTLMDDDDNTKHLRESINVRQLRPLPPPETHYVFKFGDEVDAFHNDGWWEGHVTEELGNGRFAVYFRVSKERLEFSKEELRIHREWVDDHWFPPFPQPMQQEEEKEKEKEKEKELNKVLLTPNVKSDEIVKPEEAVKPKENLFSLGALVEVSSDEDGFLGAWFSATVLEARGRGGFLVEYKNLMADDGIQLLREDIDALHIRPPPPEIGVAEFSLFDEVDAWTNDGWWVGVISKILGDSRYVVYFRTSNEVMEFDHSQLRVHQDFIGGKWVMASKLFRH